MQNRNHFDVLISGGGPSGLSAVSEALKAGKKVGLVINRGLGIFIAAKKSLSFMSLESIYC